MSQSQVINHLLYSPEVFAAILSGFIVLPENFIDSISDIVAIHAQ